MLIVISTSLMFSCLASSITALMTPSISADGELTSPPAEHHFLQFLNSGGVKVIFFAGLEGTGHHLLEAVMKYVDYEKLDFGVPTWKVGGHWKKEGFNDFVNILKSLNPEKLHVLPQQMSYPMSRIGGHEGRLTYDYPRLDWIQEAVRMAGASLHVLHLYRDLDDCLAADCLHRQFENCSDEAETLATMGSKLREHLALFGPIERSCFHYGSSDQMKHAVADVFGKRAADIFPSIYAESAPQGMRDKVKNWPNLVSSLQPTQRSLLDMCNLSPPLDLLMLKRIGVAPFENQTASRTYSGPNANVKLSMVRKEIRVFPDIEMHIQKSTASNVGFDSTM